ncbi:MAG: hypothetical protein KF745_05490 [Phycisphaeraceae bacterium]|nr:hypothetical protein [Phycisphaeraceae bacterium]
MPRTRLSPAALLRPLAWLCLGLVTSLLIGWFGAARAYTDRSWTYAADYAVAPDGNQWLLLHHSSALFDWVNLRLPGAGIPADILQPPMAEVGVPARFLDRATEDAVEVIGITVGYPARCLYFAQWRREGIAIPGQTASIPAIPYARWESAVGMAPLTLIPAGLLVDALMWSSVVALVDLIRRRTLRARPCVGPCDGCGCDLTGVRRIRCPHCGKRRGSRPDRPGPRRRIAFRIVIAAMIGAAATITTSLMVAWRVPTGIDSLSTHWLEYVGLRRGWPFAIPGEPPGPNEGSDFRSAGVSISMWLSFNDKNQQVDEYGWVHGYRHAEQRAWRMQVGIPFVAMEARGFDGLNSPELPRAPWKSASRLRESISGVFVHTTVNGRPDARLLPVRPLWPGFALNSAIYAAAAFALLTAAARLNTALRRRRAGHCATCGYAVNELPQCPECGTASARQPAGPSPAR